MGNFWTTLNVHPFSFPLFLLPDNSNLTSKAMLHYFSNLTGILSYWHFPLAHMSSCLSCKLMGKKVLGQERRKKIAGVREKVEETGDDRSIY